jgi:hypothetical protein
MPIYRSFRDSLITASLSAFQKKDNILYKFNAQDSATKYKKKTKGVVGTARFGDDSLVPSFRRLFQNPSRYQYHDSKTGQ